MFVNSKPGVDPLGLKPEALFGLMVCAGVFSDLGQKFTVTSLTDGQHTKDSFHYLGLAFDIRTRDLRGVQISKLAFALQDALGSFYQVIVEADHIHVEFQHG